MTSPAENLSKQKKPRKPVSGKKTPWKCRVGEERRRLRLTQGDVCDAVGISKATLSVIERGTDPMLSTAVALAKFFDFPIEELWQAKPQ